jgi:predicted RNase H-like nuclease (RuvC/YqgF family)
MSGVTLEELREELEPLREEIAAVRERVDAIDEKLAPMRAHLDGVPLIHRNLTTLHQEFRALRAAFNDFALTNVTKGRSRRCTTT